MRFLSVCSGIEAASVAWQPLGWEAVAFSEIEPFPCAVLKHHYPHIPNWGDMTQYQEWPDAPINLLCGGTPCQSFSVAGLRKGLADPRGNLMLTFGAIAAKYRPQWLVWENVPGVLSSNKGRDFGAFLGMLGQLGYGFAYRVLDAQYFGVAQRRRRVFVVAHLGDWRRAAAVLFERHSLSGDTAPRREAGKVAPTIPSRSTAGGGLGTDFDCDGGVITMAHGQGGAEIGFDRGPTLTCNHEAPIVARSLLAGGHTNNPLDETLVTHTLRGEGFDAGEDGTGRGTPLVPVAFQYNMSGANAGGTVELCGTLKASNAHAVAYTTAVRRLTPRECERLQGFPDFYTQIPWRKKPAGECPDGPRYKALGNSWAVPVARWIGKRIEQQMKHEAIYQILNERIEE